MSKYKLRYLIAVGVLLTLPAFTCGVGPVLRNLIQRVETLETESELLTEQVGALEAGSALLQEEVEALEAQWDGLQAQVGVLAEESAVLQAENNAQQAEIDALAVEADTTPIVIDGTGEILGPVIGGAASSALTQIDLPDVPLFLLQVTDDDLTGPCVDAVEFESTDCTGQAWMDTSGMNTVWGQVMRITDASNQNSLFYVGDPSDGPHAIVIRSTDACGRGCQPAGGGQDTGFRATPVDLDAMFTPPFRVTTWERMEALR